MEYVYHNGVAYAREEDIKREEKREKKKLNLKHDKAFTLLQISVCVFILILFLVFKAIGGETYEKIREFYIEKMYSSIVAKEDIEKIGEVFAPSKEKS